MELIPKTLVVAVVIPVPPPGMTVQGAPEITFDRLNHVFGELAPSHGYRNFQTAPDGSAGQIQSSVPGNAIIIQPPLIQFQDSVELSPEKSADKALDVFKVIAKHLKITQIIQVGVKWVVYAPAPEKDGRGFVLHRLLGRTDDDLGALSLGGSLWGGAKFVAAAPDSSHQYTTSVEPLQADPTMLFIDVDAAYLMNNEIAQIGDRVNEVYSYTNRALKTYLEKF